MMKTKTLLLLLAALFVLPLTVRAQEQTLVLTHADGTTTEVELYTMPRIRLTADKLVITVQGTSQEFDKSDVVRFTYKGINTGISTVRPETRYRVDADRVTFYGLSASDRISVYNTGGVQMPVSLTVDGNDAVLSLAQLPQGVYLVTFNGKTLKFVRP
mgnify:FL=1